MENNSLSHPQREAELRYYLLRLMLAPALPTASTLSMTFG